MIISLAQYIAGFLLQNDAIDGKKLDIYIYGFEILISSIINILIALIIGFVFSQAIECVIFLVIFIYMRKYCGGYHAETYLKCNVIFAINIILVMLIVKESANYPMYVYLLISIICLAAVALFAPIANKYKPIDKEKKKRYRLIAVTLGILFSALAIVAYFFNPHYCIAIDSALLSVAVSMVIEKIMKGSGYNEKEIREENS